MLGERELSEAYDEHRSAVVPEGVLESFLLYRIVRNPNEAHRWLVCPGTGAREGIIRAVRDSLYPVENEIVFARWRALAASNWLYAFWSFILAYVMEECVQNVVKATWTWNDATGLEIYDCIFRFVCEEFNHLLEAPVLPRNAEEILLSKWLVLFNAVGLYDLRAVIMGGKLRPMTISLSRNAHRERSMDMREQASLRRDREVSKAIELKKRRKKAGEPLTPVTPSIPRDEESSDVLMGDPQGE
jgi:hypothetical protein